MITFDVKRVLMRSARTYATSLLILPLLLVAAMPEAVGAQDYSRKCRDATWDTTPGWFTSGAWTRAGDLVAADATSNEITRFRPKVQSDGSIVLEFQQVVVKKTAEFEPREIRDSADGFMAFGVAQRIPGEHTKSIRVVALNKSLQTSKPVELFGSVDEAGNGKLVSALNWSPGARDDVVLFGDIDRSANYVAGLVRFSLSESRQERRSGKPPQFVTHLVRGSTDEPIRYYSFFFPYVTTTTSGTTYAILMDSTPSIIRLTENGFGYEMSEEGRLPLAGRLEQQSPRSQREYYEQVQYLSLPVGIYSDDLYVYTLHKKSKFTPAERRWTLSRFRLDANSLEAAPRETAQLSILPETEHVTLVLGEKDWLIVEKGPIDQHKAKVLRTRIADSAIFRSNAWDSTSPVTLCSNPN